MKKTLYQNIYFILKIFIIFIYAASARSEIEIKNWQEDINLTNNCKNSKIIIAGEVHSIPKNSYHGNFSIIFDKKQKINIKKVKFDNKIAQYSFNKNKLDIIFNSKKINNQQLKIEYEFNEIYKNNNKYLRQEFISAPKWISGANAKINLSIPNHLNIVSIHKNLQKINNKIIYQGKVSKSGLSELIKLTPKSSIWNLEIDNHINTDQEVKSLTAKIPIYFLGSGQKIKNSKVISNLKINSSETKDRIHYIKYNDIKPQNINIKLQANIKSGSNNRININRNPSQYLEISKKDRQILQNILNKIKTNPKYLNLPLYAKIGKFVHDYIKYDKSYVGKLLQVKSILDTKKGVCIEYATLFNALARAANIPAIVINGIANGEYDKFERHSWNLIYYQNKWIEVDPTWDLMSGIVSSSHIYFYDNDLNAINAEWTERSNQSTKVLLNSDFKINETE